MNVGVLIGGVCLAGMIYVACYFHASLREQVRKTLESTHRANVAAFQNWLDEQLAIATEVASMADVHRDAIFDASGGRQTTETLERDNLRLAERWQRRSWHWALLQNTGQVLTASSDDFSNRSLPLTRRNLALLADGNATWIKPFRVSASDVSASNVLSNDRNPSNETEDGETKSRESNVREVRYHASVVPLRDGVETFGAIAIIQPADSQFTNLFVESGFGRTGRTFAFDRDATVLTRTNLNHSISSTHDRSQLDHSRRLTRMADSATRGGADTDLSGYRNHDGELVIGSWQWLEDFDLGIATEMSAEEAYAPLKAMWVRTAIVLVIITGCLGLLYVSPRNAQRVAASSSSSGGTPARRLGDYELQQRIGRGGMGTVYLATHEPLERRVAIKVLENADATERSLARFRREVRLSAQLMHPNTIDIYDFGRTPDGTFYYVMEFVEGISLEQLVDYYDRQPPDRVIYLLVQICGSIAEAHAAGLVHRDIKPANILLTSRSGIHDLIKVVDFGLAKQLDHESVQLTRTDSLTGTPLYMSPESIRDASTAGVLSDIYSIGAVGYTLLCGSPPFAGDSADVCAQKLHADPELPHYRIGGTIPDDLQQVLMQCLRRDPKERPQSAKELAARLLACADSPHWTQTDAGIWWQEIFDGPYLEDFEAVLQSTLDGHTRGETAVNAPRPPKIAPGGTTAS
ncbi:serine/threonine-protein kinase [Rhodopirellula sp. MGV]|uniref:serine/threonine-protein kinase n=1 Tax=Rhodopirellula sp. MGV TaxID=2023130 RepID=UPI00130407E5|nr:serine/threonine-protein kinase [Rhodopirellula sp. MGV]